MRLCIRHKHLPADLDGALFVAPLREDAKNIYNAGGGIDAAAPATETVDADGSYIDPDTGLITDAQANVLRVGGGIDLASRNKGALFEVARENPCLQSEDVLTTWLVNSATVEGNTAAAPDGTLSADTVEDTASASLGACYQTLAIADDSLPRVFSAFIKKNGGERYPGLRMSLLNGTSVAGRVFIDVQTGALVNIDDTVASGAEDLGDYWRLWMRVDNNGTGNTLLAVYLYPAMSTDGIILDVAALGTNVFWGMQIEEDVLFPSFYIKTTTAPVTRAADDIRFGNASEINLKAASGTLYFAVTHGETDAAADRYLFDSRVAGDADGIAVILQASDNHIHVIVRSGGVTVADLDSGETWVRGDTEVIAVSWKLNEFTLYIDGVQKAQDTAGAAPTAVNATLYLGQDNGNANQPTVQLAHVHDYDDVHIAARVLTNSNEILKWLGL